MWPRDHLRIANLPPPEHLIAGEKQGPCNLAHHALVESERFRPKRCRRRTQQVDVLELIVLKGAVFRRSHTLRWQRAHEARDQVRLGRLKPNLLHQLLARCVQRGVWAGEMPGARNVEQTRVGVFVCRPALQEQARPVRQPHVHRPVPVAVPVHGASRLGQAQRRRRAAWRQRLAQSGRRGVELEGLGQILPERGHHQRPRKPRA
mmetsp:Transcript_34412/g.111078  ORF Transcript_34412/g.111078 Transcript_34412/m.111078 type:complete len:205 (+) Transcript_34412:244-858(+)